MNQPLVRRPFKEGPKNHLCKPPLWEKAQGAVFFSVRFGKGESESGSEADMPSLLPPLSLHHLYVNSPEIHWGYAMYKAPLFRGYKYEEDSLPALSGLTVQREDGRVHVWR